MLFDVMEYAPDVKSSMRTACAEPTVATMASADSARSALLISSSPYTNVEAYGVRYVLDASAPSTHIGYPDFNLSSPSRQRFLKICGSLAVDRLSGIRRVALI